MSEEKIMESAIRALLYEVSATPKPGLVDRLNNGAHNDMDFFSFIDSSVALHTYFYKIKEAIAALYRQWRTLPPAEAVFQKLVPLGIDAEAKMKQATGGVNTHKGAIYALGLLTSASLECLYLHGCCEIPKILKRVSDYVAPTLEKDFAHQKEALKLSYGQIQYEQMGLLGARGEAYHQYASATEVGIPMLETALERGCDINRAMLHALIGLMASVMDSNVIGRHNVEMLKASQCRANEVLEMGSVFTIEGMAAITAYDQWCIDSYVSHGGCADLLAVSVYLHFVKEI
ncbi:triphosphoribosyl-dephospho-CoA synthase [Fusibacter paucivorans]|uniref:triphosphoribosyl-dephospho-CoA synthase n=1 Tax=Fusibacter paucivorans TaxID=76009 RepID=A0ABS5PL84_9FIRM|nr:triphosphoribosyl-dephospho-CoA synthase [Fusibacter paucivorans]MBS7525081.1 triphosphoribosyl-dephospho-CoA synthase [Fusibacter paucivorans]